MLYTEESVRCNIRSRDGKRVFFLGKNDKLTSAARDYLQRERIAILPAEEARPERYRLLWGGYTEEKPEHMTHLDGITLAPKTHPRIVFRGKLDSLEARLIACRLEAPEFDRELGELLAYTRRLLRCEVLGEPVEEGTLLGMTEQELRCRSHFPQDYYGQTHFMPETADGPVMAQLNLARCAAREAELAAAAAFTGPDGQVTRLDLIRAMNRLSSAIYLLMIRQKRKEGSS